MTAEVKRRYSRDGGTALLHSQKCQYALRALYELARHPNNGPTRISDIAQQQAIPPRFLENILNELKQGGFVDSVRGRAGGYLLTRDPESLTIGEVIRYIQGPIAPVHCMFHGEHADCPLRGECPYLPMWERAEKALKEVYDTTTFADLIKDHKGRGRRRKRS